MGLTSRREAIDQIKRIRSYKREQRKRINITFPCTLDNIHTFSFLNGDLKFFNHDIKELKATAVLDRLANPRLVDSQACGCVKVLRYIMESRNPGDIPYGYTLSTIRDSMSFMSNVKDARARYRSFFKEDIPASKAVENKFLAMLQKLYEAKLEYRRPTKTEYNGKTEQDEEVPIPLKINVALGEPDINGWLKEGEKRHYHDKENDVAQVNITIDLKAFGSLYSKGVAVVDGCAVLSRMFDFPNNSFLALVGKQTYGYKITKEYAIVHPERNHISWISEEKAREILVNKKIPRSRRTKKELGKE